MKLIHGCLRLTVIWKSQWTKSRRRCLSITDMWQCRSWRRKARCWGNLERLSPSWRVRQTQTLFCSSQPDTWTSVTEENCSLLCLSVFLFVSLVQTSSRGSRVKCEWCCEWKWKLWNSWKRSHTDWTLCWNAAGLSQTLSPRWGGRQTLI